MKMKYLSEVHTRTEKLRNELLEAGAYLVGFADLSYLDSKVTKGYSYGICFSLQYDSNAVDMLPNDEPFLKMSAELRKKASKIYEIIATYLDDLGYHYTRISSSVEADELPDLSEELPQKTIATLAGLGWIGKSTLLVSADHGPRIRLGVMLTDAPFKTDSPVVKSNCNDCNACVNVCPVGAITGLNWSQGHKRVELLDVRLCNNYLLQGLKTIGRKHICGLCLKACPIGR
jgi:epoxyqueuosine reductase